MKELNYKEARELILQGKKVARNFDLKIYVYFKDGQLVREEKTNNKRLIKSIYANGISFFDELFKGNEENNSYKFMEVE
nr:MAG TPA: Protein of unknown function (DUF2829) [Caudoviricetes sp.]DAK40354.1 MAG TPA: Protein of unknown function (DUF2829) [Caudoviricetes sp.]DAT80039.1 MAG TPA: Protein of unknown function (DUF2829) [Caudoviricetes sp.]